MKVLFVFSLFDVHSKKKPLRGPDHIQFGISYISAMLKQHGHETSLVVLGRPLRGYNRTIVDRRLATFAPEVVAFTAVSSEYPFIEDTARFIRARAPETYLIAGGPHVTLNPSEGMLGVFDALCVGEGEEPMLELVTSLAENRRPAGIANLWIRHGDLIEKNPTRPYRRDIDELPFPDRQMWQEWTELGSDSVFPVLLGRGCPFGCTYCSNHALKDVAPGPYVRMRSPDSIVSEVRELKNAQPDMAEVYLEVESFVSCLKGANNLDWAIAVCNSLAELNALLDEPLSFGVNVRVAPLIDFERLFEACRRCNVSFVNIGLESGSARIRRNVLKRSYSNRDIKHVAAAARRHGLHVVFYNMVGLPGEDEAEFRKTIELNRECVPDWYYLDIFYPYPGTELHDLCLDNGWIDGTLDSRMERSRAVMDLPGFSRRQIQRSYTWFDYHVHKGEKPLWKILPHVAARKLKSRPLLFYIYRRLTRIQPLRHLKWVAKRA